MLSHTSSDQIFFDASLYYSVGIFDIYDQEETKGTELTRYNPNNTEDRKNLILKYCLVPYNKLSYCHRYKSVDNLALALNTENYNFHPYLEDDLDKHSTMAWDKKQINAARAFFSETYYLANDAWKEDLRKASLEEQSTW
jgi:hypothetical protein